MFVMNKGYCFNARKASDGVFGVTEAYVNRGGVKLTVGVSAAGVIVSPNFFNKERHLTPVTDEDYERLIRGNVGVYDRMGDAVYIMEYELRNGTDEINIYVPEKNEKFDGGWKVICKRLSLDDALYTRKVSNALYASLESGIREQIRGMDIGTRKDFIKCRIRG